MIVLVGFFGRGKFGIFSFFYNGIKYFFELCSSFVVVVFLVEGISVDFKMYVEFFWYSSFNLILESFEVFDVLGLVLSCVNLVNSDNFGSFEGVEFEFGDDVEVIVSIMKSLEEVGVFSFRDVDD